MIPLPIPLMGDPGGFSPALESNNLKSPAKNGANRPLLEQDGYF
jgi:hypothetical protein